MANKKFYYHGKKNTSTTNKPAGAAQRADSRYPVEKTSVTLEALGVSPSLAELLGKNRISTAGDLVRRTEKDMFRVQGFNKKMLFELRDLLKAQGMEFNPDPAAQPVQQKAQQKPAKQPERNGARSAAEEAPRREKARGTDERRQKPVDGKNGKPEQRPAKSRDEKPQKPAKLTEPLPVEEWRKIQKSGKWGFYDGFKTVIPAMYDEVFCFKEGLASVENDEKCGYINPQNEVVIPLEYETAMSFSEGYASVVKGGKCGYINKNNEVVIPFVYDAATPFEDGEAKVKKDGKWGTLTPDGTVKWI